uniref:TATA element modulatory factor n=1 Tax=Geotrypetes seraphini TaxID=260995 RepID=A0A6P8PKN6_GEOSA|nr:TATA element modulatory factor [Geotrypetes seraphini]
MSWFTAAQLSVFAKQALSQAQKSIDRVLDITEDQNPWADTVVPTFEDGKSSSIIGSWDTSTWGLNSDEEPETQPSLSPTAITKPVTRTVIDESENFFSAFLSQDVQSITNSSVVSKPPAKSQRPKEVVKSTLEKSVHRDLPDSHSVAELETKEESPSLPKELKQPDIPQEDLAAQSKALGPHGQEEIKINERSDEVVLSVNSHTLKADVGVECSTGKSETQTALKIFSQCTSPETKAVVLDTKEQKPEDRQSDTPSPPISTFSSGTSTTSDIEILDHESVISESSASSRQEVTDSKASLHLMPTSFQLLSAPTCSEYNRLDDYQKLTESCSSSDAFERIDSVSVQSLDSHSVSEINSDDELSGRGCALGSVAVDSPTPKADANVSLENKLEEELNDTLVVHAVEETEMEESGRSATPVNLEQPDVLITTVAMNEGQDLLIQQEGPLQDTENQPGAHVESEDVWKQINELTAKLEKRETQLLIVSKEKARLEEAFDNLSDEMLRLQEESSNISSVREEFTQRIAEAEKKVKLACKERDVAKKEVKMLKEELATRLNSNETLELLKEKDAQINELLEEGEKLSKQQLRNSNIIKKLRAQEKDSENISAKQSKKIKELEEELQHLRQVLDGKEELEKQHRENIKKLNSVVEREERDLSRLQADMEELQENNRSLQATLDSSFRELAELHKTNAAKDSVAQEAALSCEMRAKEELSIALEQAQEEGQRQQEALVIQVADLRLALQRAEQQAARKEDYLRQEISELQQRLQEAENRNQELSQSVTSATRPLLRQIENLQAALGAQTSSWEKLEKTLSDRLGESQTLLAAALEKERATTEELLIIKTHVSSAESQSSLLRKERSRLQAQLEVEKSRLIKIEEDNSRYQVELECLKLEHTKTCEEARREKTLLSSQLEMEKMKVEQEKKKVILAQEAIKEKERKVYAFSTAETIPSTPSLSRSSSVSGVDMAGLQTSFLSQDDSFASISGSNLYEAVRMGAGSSIIENLQSQLKLREGEITQLQLEIGNLEKTRAIMAEELVKLTNLNDELEEKVKEIPKLRVQLRDLDQRYNTILQMYGEKAEKAEELRLDLEDVKNMYKTQIDELLKQRLS